MSLHENALKLLNTLRAQQEELQDFDLEKRKKIAISEEMDKKQLHQRMIIYSNLFPAPNKVRVKKPKVKTALKKKKQRRRDLNELDDELFFEQKKLEEESLKDKAYTLKHPPKDLHLFLEMERNRPKKTI